MNEPVGQLAIVGKQDKSFRKEIQTSGRVQSASAPSGGNEIKDGHPAFRVPGCGNHAHGLVQHEVAGGAGVAFQLSAVDFDSVDAGTNLQAGGLDCFPVDLHRACGDEFVCLAARTYARVGQRLVDAYRLLFHGSCFLLPFPARFRGGR